MKHEFLYISNLLDLSVQNKFSIFQGRPIENLFYKPLFIQYKNSILGSVIALDIFPYECITRNGIIKARKQFLRALKYAYEEFNIKVVLLAASTKRLFGKDIEIRINWNGFSDEKGFTLRELYPEILFTNGDNGTAIILEMEINSILEKENIKSEDENLCNLLKDGHRCSGSVIINGLGLLGTNSLLHLIENQFCDKQVIVISNHTKELDNIIGQKNVRVYSHISEIQNHCCLGNKNHVKMIVNCTHHPSQIIKADDIAHIQNGQTVNVIDVAVPYGFPKEEYLKCRNVYRQDGGNAYLETGLKFWFNPEICGLKEKVLYGCFAETLVLSAFLKENPDEIRKIREFDLFNVNKETKIFVKDLFKYYGIGISPVPLNFNK